MIYNVKWNDSKSKIIYRATKHSEYLMDYLEQKLFENELVKMVAERPIDSPGRQYGAMFYYYKTNPNRVLLTSAPRRDHNYIHVELRSKIIDRETLISNGLTTGNYKEPKASFPDLKMHSESEIDKLIELMRQNNYKLY